MGRPNAPANKLIFDNVKAEIIKVEHNVPVKKINPPTATSKGWKQPMGRATVRINNITIEGLLFDQFRKDFKPGAIETIQISKHCANTGRTFLYINKANTFTQYTY